jgi:hypothetical protein
VAFGPVADPSGLYRMAVVDAPDEQEVRILAESDPVISTGTFISDVFTMPQALARPVRNSPSARARSGTALASCPRRQIIRTARQADRAKP